MATWPADGDENWNTKMLAFLAVSFNTDGTLKATVVADVVTGEGIFGTWTDKDSDGSDALATGNVYKVGSDGFVTFYVDEDWTGNDWIRLYTDNSATPTTKRITLKDINLGALGEITGFCPIKKNDYWKIDVTGLTAGNVTIYWLPIGSGTCVKQ